ncbi:MAG: UDP-N-acetylmuramoyl-tripeptide--D-alanyl-D-alanine ligase [Patescibacteria group bacterium]|nr:UDP-N-acetylmuramoyl-tripeptide--D-alanyl-D-alanine ligase [Patescibacteria group bacterium]
MKKLIQLQLKILAKMILAKYKPDVIGITGSVGKTSAKEAIWTVLASKFNARRNVKNYNNEIGVPLTIINADSPGKSMIGWMIVFFKALKLILLKDKDYPKILVLEMGVDRPGDMKYLNSIVKCKVGVVITVGPVHLEFFGSINNVQKEKAALVKNLAKSGWAVLNYDDDKVMQMQKNIQAKILTYGFNEKADVRAQELIFSFDTGMNSNESGTNKTNANNLAGINFKLSYQGSAVPVLLPKVIGQAVVYAALAGAAVGIAYGLNLVEIAYALRRFKSPCGRMNLIAGIKNTLIIDDTYNSSPQSSISALDVVSKISLPESARRFAVLGDMLELGSISEQAHRQIGQQVVKLKINKLVVVGERARDIARGAEQAGMLADHIFHFAQAEQAGKFIQKRINESDLILIKGSQGVRMEKIVKEIMAEPLRAKELLVRQDEQWLSEN